MNFDKTTIVKSSKSVKGFACLVFSLALLVSVEAFAQDIIPTKGKEFWVGFMQNYEVETFQEELNLFVVSDQATTGLVEIPGQGWSSAFTVNPNQTTTVTIPNDIAEHFSNEIVDNRGILVTTEDTVAVFAINFNGFTADGTKILPTPSLGIDYRISSYQGLGSYGSEFLVVATEDGTEVEITPAEETLGGNPAGVPFLVQLDRGESYQVKVAAAGGDLMGTTIVATPQSGECRPFAVFSGTSCTNIPTNCTACDHIFEQNFSTDTWGSEFYVVPFSFASSYTYRVMAHEDNTDIQIDGVPTFNLNAGEFEEFNDVDDVRCVTANKGISVTQYMEGVSCAGSGDPAMLILNDVSQKIDNITFSTVNSTVITEHGLNVIIESSEVGTLTLDGVQVDPNNFNQFPSCPDHSYAQLTLTEGSHTLNAPAGFTAYAYGTGNAESYAYSVGSFKFTEPIQVDTVLCSSGEVNLGVNEPWSNIFWYGEAFPEDTLAFGNALTLTPPYNTDIYVAVGEQFVSGCQEFEYFSVENLEPPLFNAIPGGETEICQYQEVQLGVDLITPGTFTYSWTPEVSLSNPNVSNPIATPLQSTTYEVLVSTLSGCSFATDTVRIDVTNGNITEFQASSLDDLICTGESTSLEVSIEQQVFEDNFDPGVSWGIWTDISGGEQSDDCGAVDGNALYFNDAGQRVAETIDMDVSSGGTVRFAIKIGNGIAPCDDTEVGDDVVLEYSTNGGGDWELIQTLFESAYPNFEVLNVPLPAAAESNATRFRWRQLANSGAGTDNWSLDDIAIGALSDAGLAYEWTPNYQIDDVNSPTPNIEPLEDTMYYLTVEDDLTGCVYTDSVFIDVGQGFVLEMTPDTVLCDAQGIQLQAIPDGDDDYNYTWSPNNGSVNNVFSATPTVSPITTTLYTVEVVSDQGCSASGQVEVTVNQLLSLDLSATLDAICVGQETQLNAFVGGISQGLDYEWSPANSLSDATIPDPIATPSSDVSYELLVTDIQSGCVLSEVIDIEVFESFTVDAGPDLSFCVVAGQQLEAVASTNEALTWEWSPAGSFVNANLASPTILADESQTFTVTASNALNCSASAEITVDRLVGVLDLGPDQTICAGSSFEIDPGFDDGFDYDWSTNENTSSIEVNSADVYALTLTTPDGCVEDDELEVFIQNLPQVNLPSDPNACEGQDFVLDAGNPGMSYDWSTTEDTQSIVVNATGLYSVQVTDNLDCVGEDEVFVEFFPVPEANLPDELLFCEDETIILDAGNPGDFYQWSTNENTQTISPNTSGIYTVTVSNAFNCSTQDQTDVLILTYPELDLGTDQALCEGDVLTLDVVDPNLNVLWSTGDTTPTIDVSNTGVYSVDVDNGACFISDQISLVFNPNPADPFGSDTIVCFDSPPYSLLLEALNAGATYTWNTGATQSNIQVFSPGAYNVEVTSANGCAQTFEINVLESCFGDFLYVPNAFTPDNDGINDVFQVKGTRVASFELEIWNRWGELVFKTDDINDFWDGSHRNGDHYAENEVYIYTINYQYFTDEFGGISEFVTKDGFVTMIR